MEVEIRDYLKTLVEEDADRNRDHLAWLRSDEAGTEEDREQQTAECERAIELAKKSLAALT